MSWTLLCEDVIEQSVQSFEDVELAVQRAVSHARATHGSPTLVWLSLDGESTMGGVVGGEQSYAGFLYQPRGPGYVARKRGALEQDQAELFTYMQFGSQSEVDPECTISAGDAWEALRRYFETGKRPETIEWGP